MKRKVVSLLLITLPLLLAAVILQFPVAAAPVQQTVPAEEAETQLAQPQQIMIRQQVPLTITVVVSSPITGTSATTSTGNLIGALINSLARPATLTPTGNVQTVGVTLTLDIQLTVTDTLTTTVPSTVTLTWPNQQVTALPIEVTVGPVPNAAVVITLLAPTAPPTVTTEITETVDITPGAILSPTAGTAITATTPLTTPATSELVAITGTVAITANLRSGPDTTFDVVSQTSPGQTVSVVAQNEDNTWYLLASGNWIAAFLVENITGDLPLATEELVTALRSQSAITTTTPVTTTTTLTATATTTPATPTAGSITLVPTPTAVAQPQPPRVTVNANLRSGPATTFPIIGGTIAGQELTIVARNEDGSWLQLDNGGWVATFLVANPPVTTTIPIFVEGATQPAAGATPIPTPTPTLTTTGAITGTTPILGVRENLYVIRVDGIIDGYDFTLTKIDTLVTAAGRDIKLLQDRAWIVEMTTAITLLRSTSDEARALAAPPLFADAHADLVRAAAAFTTAADLLAEGVDQLDTERLDEAFAEITVGSSFLTRTQNAVDAVTP